MLDNIMAAVRSDRHRHGHRRVLMKYILIRVVCRLDENNNNNFCTTIQHASEFRIMKFDTDISKMSELSFPNRDKYCKRHTVQSVDQNQAKQQADERRCDKNNQRRDRLIQPPTHHIIIIVHIPHTVLPSSYYT